MSPATREQPPVMVGQAEGRRPRLTRGAFAAIALLALLGQAPALSASSPERGVSRFQGEELFYTLEFLGTSMARGALVVGHLEEHESGRALIPVQGMAVTEGVAALIYPMRDLGQTFIDPVTGLAHTTFKELDERGQYRSYQVDFSHQEYLARVARVRDGATQHYERLVPSTTHDAFSWIYAIREQDLTPGATQVYFVYDGWRLSRVTATVVAEEREILVGDEFINSRRINLYREVMDSRRPLPMIQESAHLPPVLWARETASGEQMGDLWVSTDRRRLPTQIEFSNALVTVTGRLERSRAPAAGYR